MSKVWFAIVLMSSLLWGYSVGDKIDPTMEKSLGLKKDKLYVVDFFASWCHSCKKELPQLSEVYAKGGLLLIGINVDKQKSLGRDFVLKHKISFPIVYDSDQKIISAFNPEGIPALYFIKNGTIVEKHIGALRDVEGSIKEALGRLR
jgi:cytochrome c biogenesis protein CcmG/thiol:disulfide interchange protein DsbE